MGGHNADMAPILRRKRSMASRILQTLSKCFPTVHSHNISDEIQ